MVAKMQLLKSGESHLKKTSKNHLSL